MKLAGCRCILFWY